MTQHSRGRSKIQADAITRFFGGMEVIEAKESLRVFANKTDKQNANQGDPESCVLAQACGRLYGSSAVLIFKTIAYVDLPDENGVRYVNRFSLGAKTTRQIVEYDQTGEFPPGGFVFAPPSKHSQLDNDRAYQKERKRRIQNGEHKVDPKRSALLKGVAKGIKQTALLTGVRDGSGMVHFVKNTGA